MFADAAPAFRSDRTKGLVHEIFVKIAAAYALIWCFRYVTKFDIPLVVYQY